MLNAAIVCPPPVALARATGTLRPADVAGPVWEPKYDGWRAVTAGGRLWSRQGHELTGFFPDLSPALSARLPADAVLDGELVAWDPAGQRLDFSALGRRLRAGARTRAVAAARPAHLVVFDVLAAGGRDVRPMPLVERRVILEQLLSGLGPPLALCQQTDDEATARRWLEDFAPAGIEGLVVKDGAASYPTRPGQRIWHKLKVRASVDVVVIGVIGDPAAPSALVLALPHGPAGELRYVGTSTLLTRTAARELGRLLEPTGGQEERWLTLPGTADGPSTVHLVAPLVVEVSADAAIDAGLLRHAARFLRARPDLTPEDLQAA